MTRLASIGEWETIRRIQKILPANKIPSPHKILVGPGDDAAVVDFSTPCRLAFTTDTLVEGTHFRLDWMRRHLSEKEIWRSLGWKAMAVNLSDLAAMGGAKPLLALLTFGGHGDISVDTVENLSVGISNISRIYGISVIGGDTIRADKSIISICLVGEILTHKQILRSGAKNGDTLMASGPLGLSSAGLKTLQSRGKIKSRDELFLLQKHLYPVPRLKEGLCLGNVEIKSTSLLDLSDDLLTSLEILSRESGVGFECDLSKVPIHPALKAFCQKSRLSPYDMILYGGEDYELLFTVPSGHVKTVLKKIPDSYVLGRTLPKKQGIRIWNSGERVTIKDARFRHF